MTMTPEDIPNVENAFVSYKQLIDTHENHIEYAFNIFRTLICDTYAEMHLDSKTFNAYKNIANEFHRRKALAAGFIWIPSNIPNEKGHRVSLSCGFDKSDITWAVVAHYKFYVNCENFETPTLVAGILDDDDDVYYSIPVKYFLTENARNEFIEDWKNKTIERNKKTAENVKHLRQAQIERLEKELQNLRAQQ